MKKRILFVIPYLCNGGAERALSNITTHFPEDYDIDILANSSKQVDYEYRGNVISMGIDSEKKVYSVWFQFKALIRRILFLKRLKKERNYLACISFSDSANLANIISGRGKTKTIVSIRISLSEMKAPYYKYLINPLAKLLYNRADCVVAVSEELRGELIRDFKIKEDKVVSIVNGYDVAKIREMAAESLESEYSEMLKDRQVVFTVGRLTNQKRQWHLIRAMKKVVEVFPNAILLIAGIGELEEYLYSLINLYGLKDQVKLIGFNRNVFRYEKNADVFVLPSGFEGFPNSLAEALCVGTPSVATDFHTGAREILAPELLNEMNPIFEVQKCSYGILTPQCSGNQYIGNEDFEEAEDLLAQAITELLSNRELSEEYRKKSLERGNMLGIDKAVEKWVSVIEMIQPMR